MNKMENSQKVGSQIILAQIHNFHQFSFLLNKELISFSKNVFYFSSLYSLWLSDMKERISSSINDNNLQIAFDGFNFDSPIKDREFNQDIELKHIKLYSNNSFNKKIDLLQTQKSSSMKRRNCHSVENNQEFGSTKLIKTINTKSEEINSEVKPINNMDTIMEQSSREDEILNKMSLNPILNKLNNKDVLDFSSNKKSVENIKIIHDSIKIDINTDNQISITKTEKKETKFQYQLHKEIEMENSNRDQEINIQNNQKNEENNLQKQQCTQSKTNSNSKCDDIKSTEMIKHSSHKANNYDKIINRQSLLKQFQNEIDKPISNNLKYSIKNTPSFSKVTPIQAIHHEKLFEHTNDNLSNLTPTISTTSSTDFTFAKPKPIKKSKHPFAFITFQNIQTNSILSLNNNSEFDSMKKSPPHIKKWINPYNQVSLNNNNNIQPLFQHNHLTSTLTKNIIDPEYEITDQSDISDEEDEEEMKTEKKQIQKWVKNKRLIEIAIANQALLMKQFKPFKIENLNLNMIFYTLNSNYNLRENSADWRLDNTIQSNSNTINETFKKLSNENNQFFPQTNRQLNFSHSKC